MGKMCTEQSLQISLPEKYFLYTQFVGFELWKGGKDVTAIVNIFE